MKEVLKYIGIMLTIVVAIIVGLALFNVIGLPPVTSGLLSGWYGCLLYMFLSEKFG
tara:strand:- start:869 stop:1036 length:168 start_codon:yes stop_codon:yes gene_type:complete